jgi:TolB-like protein/pimeloyl-ACP methyl ester carboxylesterase/Tfp pilus assembly protein PilF
MRYVFGEYALDANRRELVRSGSPIHVEPQVFDLILYLIQNRDHVVSKDDLLTNVWGGRIVSESTLSNRINAARRALGDSGEQQQFIKTIARRGLRFVGEVREAPQSTAAPEEPATPLAVPERPSIAVLPFANMSGDPEQDFFADGITEGIIIALSRVRWFFVISRSTTLAYKNRDVDAKQIALELGVRYVLTGSVRRDGERVRVTSQLIEGVTGGNVWARSYDLVLSDVFAVQDDITQTIVGAIEPELSRAERERAKVRPRDSLDAWSIYQHGMSHLYRYTRESLAAARKLFEQAIAIDPDIGPAYSGLAEALYYEVVYGFAENVVENRERALGPAQRAVDLDAEDAAAHCTLGRIRYFRREYAAAISELRLALDINPSLALAHYGLGAAYVFSGRASEAFGHLEAAIRLSPHDPNLGSFLVRLAEAKYLVGDDESAVAFALKAIGQPHFQWSRYAILIAALGQLGRMEEAQSYLNEIRRHRPEFSVAFVQIMHPFSRDMGIERYYEGLRKAGVPERPAAGSPGQLESDRTSPASTTAPQKVTFCQTSDGVNLALATSGSGMPVVKAANWLNHIEFDWQSPLWLPLFTRLSERFRLVRYDGRANGLSDWDVKDVSLEAAVRDMETVVDTLGLERFALFGISYGAAVSICYAARHPERVSRLILSGGYAQGWLERGNAEEIARRAALVALIRNGWGLDNPAFRQVFTSCYMPEATAEEMKWFNDLQRMSASPENAARLMEIYSEIDVLDLLPRVVAPTLVLHSRGDAAIPFAQGLVLARGIPNARFVALDSNNHLVLSHEPAWNRYTTEICDFLSAAEPK